MSITFADVKNVIYKVRDMKGRAEAIKIIQEAGQADHLGVIEPHRFQAVFDAAHSILHNPASPGRGV